jgi:hypothetical protein
VFIQRKKSDKFPAAEESERGDGKSANSEDAFAALPVGSSDARFQITTSRDGR